MTIHSNLSILPPRKFNNCGVWEYKSDGSAVKIQSYQWPGIHVRFEGYTSLFFSPFICLATVTQCLRGCETMGNHVTSRLVGRPGLVCIPCFVTSPYFFCCITKHSQSFFNVQGNKKTQKCNKKARDAVIVMEAKTRKTFTGLDLCK